MPEKKGEMKKTYGEKKGEEVFHTSVDKGAITGSYEGRWQRGKKKGQRRGTVG